LLDLWLGDNKIEAEISYYPLRPKVSTIGLGRAEAESKREAPRSMGEMEVKNFMVKWSLVRWRED
jgi:hypothetical protein